MCEHDIYPTIGLAALNLGGPIGVYFFGVLNDRWDKNTKSKFIIPKQFHCSVIFFFLELEDVNHTFYVWVL